MTFSDAPKTYPCPVVFSAGQGFFCDSVLLPSSAPPAFVYQVVSSIYALTYHRRDVRKFVWRISRRADVIFSGFDGGFSLRVDILIHHG
jgi:hypothetical protein